MGRSPPANRSPTPTHKRSRRESHSVNRNSMQIICKLASESSLCGESAKERVTLDERSVRSLATHTHTARAGCGHFKKQLPLLLLRKWLLVISQNFLNIQPTRPSLRTREANVVHCFPSAIKFSNWNSQSLKIDLKAPQSGVRARNNGNSHFSRCRVAE